VNFLAVASTWFKSPGYPYNSSGSGIFTQGEVLDAYYNIDNEATDHFSYADVDVDIDGPSITEDAPSVQTETDFTAEWSDWCTAELGVAYPGAVLEGSTADGVIVDTTTACTISFSCAATVTVASELDSSVGTAYYWWLLAYEGYYDTPDGAGTYLYEQVCYLFKTTYANYAAGIYTLTWDTTTIFESFEITGSFNENATVFGFIVGDNGLPYETPELTTLTVSDGEMSWTGSDLDSYVAGVNIQARVFSEDTQASS